MRKRVLGNGLLGLVHVAGLAFVVTSGCKSDSEPEKNAAAPQEQAASISTGPVVDNKIAKAVANAAQAQPAAASAAKGPPENGILGKTRADEELRSGEPAKLKLGSTGSEPRVQLGSTGSNAVAAFDKKGGGIDTAIRTGASVFPSAAFKLEFARVQGASGTAQTTEGSDSGSLGVTFVGSELSTTQQAQIPAELGAEVRKLKGSRLTFSTNGQTIVSGPVMSLAKEANPQVGKLVQAAASGLSEALVPLPQESVGVGAFWMVTSRDDLLGTDVVAYRMVKVTQIQDGQVRLEVNTKRYLAADDLGSDFENAKALQFHADGSAELVFAVGQPLPIEGRSQTAIRTFAEIEGTPRPIQIEFRNEFAFK